MKKKALILLGVAIISLSAALPVAAAMNENENAVTFDTQDVAQDAGDTIQKNPLTDEATETPTVTTTPEVQEPSVAGNLIVEGQSTTEGQVEESQEMSPNIRSAAVPNRWIQSSGRWWYCHNDGKYTKNGWEYIDGKWYYFDGTGWMRTGWISASGKWYYLGGSNDGAMKTGWQKISGKWYYLGGVNDGAMKANWQKINGKWYYLGGANDGAMKANWQKINGKWYYLGGADDGAMKTGWQKINGVYYFLDYTNGDMAENEWVSVYYVDGSGKWIPNYGPGENASAVKIVLEFCSGGIEATKQKKEITDVAAVKELEAWLKSREKTATPNPDAGLLGADEYHIKIQYDDGKERYYTSGDFADLIRNEQGYYHVTASELQAIWQNGGR